MRSISTKLIVAFLSIGIISVAVIFLSARWNTREEFIKFLSDQSETNIYEYLSDYYLQNGSWDGVEVFLGNNNGHRPGMGPGMGPGIRPETIQPFTLIDKDGFVVISNERFSPGEKIPVEKLNASKEIFNDNKEEVVGHLFLSKLPFQGKQRELEFIDRTNSTLLYGAIIGAVIALILGIFLSRTITRPIRELTQATHAVSEGDLTQQVSINSKDELGELGKAFNKMSAELSRAVNTRKQMIADIAHELRTPLSLILGHAEAVHDGVLPPTKENFEIIREEASRLDHLVEDLRTLSLADAGELPINPQPTEPGRLIQEAASLFQMRAQKKNIKLDLDIAPHLPTLELDPGRMTQVLTNILDNATRHTPESGQIVLSAVQWNDQVKITIEDSGQGLPPEDISRIFERFYRTDSSRQRNDKGSGGSGLGLAIAKSIVQAHNGQLSAESEAGQGLKIIISLPL